MIRLSAVSYLNTKPFVEGLRSVFSEGELSLRLEIPAASAGSFERGEADIALVPAGSLPRLPQAHLLDRYCIGADGKVDSVYLFANRPVHELDTIYLDSHSNTSNGLARILAERHWQVAAEFCRLDGEGPEINDRAGAVLIGDKALPLRQRFDYQYDLAAEWKALTGLPMVFAVWVYDPAAVSEADIRKLYRAFELGISAIPQIARQYANESTLQLDDLIAYYESSIDYTFDATKHRALTRYLQELAAVSGSALPPVTVAPAVQLIG